ncbi:beta-glucosidase BoGH3B isoform X1 [Helianthus annuus]|uniref:beta-glucosidase BoGH3B isoform X1 n=1 Tax=Helianthus annuus TaxID=4232 RepID=UPI001652F5AC|nr:beta-glucosidase BoGH3B isoform X1 [Helianthus annuus]XP_035831658.1 beta-glucosidase BoGH3B isoform X1 [Helianthus annuus]XP_035831660.1 beta-glucosidase BoGH3B isoform X1 [Helianthus annuus]XP_035831662.1 beta-glucosidase BoGH3B isoform X1 [Helianthus annuus]XP_035831665.1 beta-glucosidase BoGH3B isoform X1 [Helianthus annuus]
MVNDFQNGALSTRLGIPYIDGIDAVHGHSAAYGATIFLHNSGLGVTRDPLLIKKIGAATALEVRANGIQYTFAPCIAVCGDPRWGRCYESYSEDPEIVRLMTKIISSLQGEITDDSEKGARFVSGQQKIAACAKHYVGDGETHLGENTGNTMISSKKMFGIHMPAYNDSVIKGVATIMTSYSSWSGVKMHANRKLVTGYLKNKLKFKGFVISDWQGIDSITDPPHANYIYSILAGINAGIDMVMVPLNYTEFIDEEKESQAIKHPRPKSGDRRTARLSRNKNSPTLKGIIRLQALVRGHLVSRQAVVTLRCMRAIIEFQALTRGRMVRLTNGQLLKNRLQQHLWSKLFCLFWVTLLKYGTTLGMRISLACQKKGR